MTNQPTANSSKTPGGLPAIPVDDRENVGTVTPDDYPDAPEADVTGKGIQSLPGLDDEIERRNPGK